MARRIAALVVVLLALSEPAFAQYGQCPVGFCVIGLNGEAAPTCGPCGAPGAYPFGSQPQITGFDASGNPESETLVGDCTLTRTLANTYSAICLKSNNQTFGTAAFQNIGTSGANVPLLNATNTISAPWTFANSDLLLLGSSTGATALRSANASATNFTLTLPAVNDTLATLGQAQTFTGAMAFNGINTFAALNTFSTPPVMSGASITNTTIPTLALAVVQGNGTKVQLSTGTTTNGHCTQYDANGNTVDSGGVCGGGGGLTCKADITLVAGVGTFTNGCVTTASACWSTDLTTPQNCCQVGAPTAGAVAVAGTGTDICRTWCQ